jgi:hypothetical protein
MAAGLISCWVQLRTAEVVIGELAAEFDGADPLRPFVRGRIEETTEELLSMQKQLCVLNMEVVMERAAARRDRGDSGLGKEPVGVNPPALVKTGVTNRAQAAVYAKDHGIA